MNRLSRFAPWIQRMVLTQATVVFTMIGLRYIANPAEAAAATGATLNSALAATTTRVGFGAFPLGIAIFTLTSLFSSRYRISAVRLVAILVSTAIVVRIIGLVTDGAVP